RPVPAPGSTIRAGAPCWLACCKTHPVIARTMGLGVSVMPNDRRCSAERSRQYDSPKKSCPCENDSRIATAGQFVLEGFECSIRRASANRSLTDSISNDANFVANVGFVRLSESKTDKPRPCVPILFDSEKFLVRSSEHDS